MRNLTRSFLASSHTSTTTNSQNPPPTPADRAATERVIRILIAILYATKNHLRAEWGAGVIPGRAAHPADDNPAADRNSEYGELLPAGLMTFEDQGLGLPLQLSFFVEQYIKRAHDAGWFHSPQASTMQAQLNRLVEAYGRMETIRLTPIPVAHL